MHSLISTRSINSSSEKTSNSVLHLIQCYNTQQKTGIKRLEIRLIWMVHALYLYDVDMRRTAKQQIYMISNRNKNLHHSTIKDSIHCKIDLLTLNALWNQMIIEFIIARTTLNGWWFVISTQSDKLSHH